ncbi:MAG: rhomboid family intramembrane serine protease [Lachnospiraceae bacterium]|nr:rhomboid family intramembrane serine protease [Lachnospiraceae bacterium]
MSLDKLERKLGRFAIRNLMIYLIILYVGGFALVYFRPGFYEMYLSLDWSMIFKGQVWRLVTYIMYPPSTSVLWFLLECFIFWSLGSSLEKMWGTFYFNLYVFIGLLANVVISFLVYTIGHMNLYFTASNLYISFLLAFAMTVPEMRFYLYMIIPVKAKYLGIFYLVIMGLELVLGDWGLRFSVIASLVNVAIFFLFLRKPILRVKQFVRRREFQQNIRAAEPTVKYGGARHRCAVCGRTELDDPNLEFRYCSKCAGGREYCLDHLYTHVHVTAGQPEEQR